MESEVCLLLEPLSLSSSGFWLSKSCPSSSEASGWCFLCPIGTIGISVVWSVVVDVVVVLWVVLVDGAGVEVVGFCELVDGSGVEVDGLSELVDGVVLLVMGLVVEVVVGDLVLVVGFGGNGVLVVGGVVVVVVVLSGCTG